MKESVVILLDVLGTKGVWQRKNPYDVIQKYDGLLTDAMTSTILLNAPRTNPCWQVDWQTYMFSDTIIFSGVWIPAEEDVTTLPHHDMLINASFVASRVISHGLSDGLLLRGCITIGEIMRGKSAIIGPAIDEASDWYEQADWIGCLFSPSAKAFIVKDEATLPDWAIGSTHSDAIVSCDIPLKTGTTYDSFAVTWPYLIDLKYWEKEGPFSEKARSDFLRMIQDLAKGPDDLLRKYKNTILFYDSFRQRAIGQESVHQTMWELSLDPTEREIDKISESVGPSFKYFETPLKRSEKLDIQGKAKNN